MSLQPPSLRRASCTQRTGSTPAVCQSCLQSATQMPYTLQVVAASGSTAASTAQRQLDTVQRQLRAEELQKQELDRRLQGALGGVLELEAAAKLQKEEQADLALHLEQAQVCTGGPRGSQGLQRIPGQLTVSETKGSRLGLPGWQGL